jgi:putative transcriptional regulator
MMGGVMESLKALLLVATPMLGDPNFDRTVVWVLEHGDDGALGVVLNRPSDLPVADPLPSWNLLTGALDVVFLGGPVSTSSVIGVARVRSGTPAGAWAPVMDEIGVLDLGIDPDDVGPALLGLRCFAGYAGWGSGQLESEIDQGAWFVVDTDPNDVFTEHPADLWRTVLARQRPELARFALVPDDPRVN